MGSRIEKNSVTGVCCDVSNPVTWAIQFGRIHYVKDVGKKRCCMEIVTSTSEQIIM